MRRVILFVIYILIIFWLIYLSVSYVIRVNVVKTHNNSNSFKKLYNLSYNFVLEANQTFKYDIPSFSDYLRFVFTPNIHPSEDLNSNINNLIFAIRYQIFDSNDRVVRTKIIYLKSSYFIYINKNSEPTITQFYLNSPLIPAKSKTLLINLNGLESVRYIKLTLLSKDKRIADIGVRGYFLERAKVDKLSKIWGRLNQEKKEKLFIGNVYPLYYISKDEKKVRLQRLFKPMAPYKVEERGYKIRELLTLKDTTGIFPYISVEPLIYSDSHLNATRILQSGRYKIDILGEGNTTLNIYDSISQVYSRDFNNTKSIFLDLNRSYLLELSSPTPQSYTITDINKSIREYLPPRVSYGYYYIDENNSIEYNLSRADNRVLLLESRALDIDDTNNTLKITISNRAKSIKELTKSISYTPSRYHYIDKFKPISEANKTTIIFPKDATAIKISSIKPSLIKLYSRDINLPYPLYSFKSFDYPLFTKLSPWLFIRANSDTNISQVKQIYIQPKPPSISETTKLGVYKFETLYPNGLWVGFDILQKRLRDINYIRKESYSSIYSLIDSNMSINFLVDDNSTTIDSVKLICIAKRASRVFFDKQLLSGLCETKGVSVYKLTNISSTPHQISVTDRSAKLFVSNTAIKDRVYIKSSFIKFDKALSFEVAKDNSTKELLKIQLAKEIDDNISIDETLLKFNKIDNQTQLFENFSFKSYQLYFDIGADRGYLIKDRGIDIGVSKPLYLPIGDNLKEDFKFTIYPQKDSNHSYYINISHIIEGIEDKETEINFEYR